MRGRTGGHWTLPTTFPLPPCPMSHMTHWGIGCQPAVELQIAAEDFVRWPPKTPAGSRTTAGPLSTAVRCRVSPIHESAMAAKILHRIPNIPSSNCSGSDTRLLEPKGECPTGQLGGPCCFFEAQTARWQELVRHRQRRIVHGASSPAGSTIDCQSLDCLDLGQAGRCRLFSWPGAAARQPSARQVLMRRS